VTLINIGTDERRTATADNSGNFSFANLLPGEYRIEVQSQGFKFYRQGPIRIEVESAVRVDLTMQVGAVAETLTITGEAPLLQTQTGTIGEAIEGRTVQDTPFNGRNPFNLIALAPGAVPQVPPRETLSAIRRAAPSPITPAGETVGSAAAWRIKAPSIRMACRSIP
jgi:Carboxypeptidase regulatory-like domain